MDVALKASLFTWGLAIAVADVRHRRIPNLLTFPVAAAALTWMLWSGRCMSGAPWLSGLAAGAFGLAVTVPAYAVRKLGAGDAKYLLVIGLCFGWAITTRVFVVAAALGATLGLVWWLAGLSPLAGGRVRRLLSPLTRNGDKSANQLYMPFGTLLSIGLCAELLNR